MPLEKRIVDLEVRAAFQDKLIADLDEVLSEFALRVENLERQLQELRESADPQPSGPANDPPPHY